MAITGKTQKNIKRYTESAQPKKITSFFLFFCGVYLSKKKSELNRALVFHMEYPGMGRYQMVDPSLPCLLFKKLPKRL